MRPLPLHRAIESRPARTLAQYLRAPWREPRFFPLYRRRLSRPAPWNDTWQLAVPLHAASGDQPDSRTTLGLLSFLLEPNTTSQALAWWEFLLTLPGPFRAPVVDLLEHDRRIATPFSRAHAGLIALLPDLIPPRAYPELVHGLLTASARGLSRELTEAWLEIALTHDEILPLDGAHPQAKFTSCSAASISRSAWVIRRAWDLCLRENSAEAFLRLPFWEQLPPAHREACFLDFADDAARGWDRERESWYRAASAIASLPVEFWHHLPEALDLWGWFRRFHLTLPLLRQTIAWRIESPDLRFLVRDIYLALPESLRSRLLALPARGIEALKRACRWSNDSGLIDSGLRRIAEAQPDLLLTAWQIAPKHLFETARTLGALPATHAEQLLRQVARHELFTIRESGLNLVQLDILLTRYRDWARRLTAYEKWDKHFAGRRILKPHVVEELARELRDQFARFRLWLIERHVLGALGDTGDVHAALIRVNSHVNRRSLQRFLRSGARIAWEFAREHPNTHRWRNRHPRIDLARWLDNLTISAELPKLGRVEIRFEEEPFEILKLGTYVGSCVGLGGCNSHAAASVLLDVNKRVAFARSAADRRFIARQLITISDRDELVCFSVYPHVAPREVKELCADFDQALAWKLAVPVFRPAPNRDYKIVPVIAPSSYDDGAWDILEAELPQ